MMENEFLNMHKEAENLVESLKKLNEEVIGYNSSKKELGELNKTLSEFIGETKKLTEKSCEIIENTSNLTPFKNEIKIDEIHVKIIKIEKDFTMVTEKIGKSEESMGNLFDSISKEIEANLNGFNDKIEKRIRNSEISIADKLSKLSTAIKKNGEEIRNKKFSIFGNKK